MDGCGRAPRTEIYLKLKENRVAEAGFTTFGCGASIACGSVLTEMILHHTIHECQQIEFKMILDALDGLPADKEFCAEIALNALRDATRQWDEHYSTPPNN